MWNGKLTHALSSHPGLINPLTPHDALKHHFTSLKTDLISLQTYGFSRKISMKLYYQYMAIFTHLKSSSSTSIPAEICDSNSRLVVDEDDNGKFRVKRVNVLKYLCANHLDRRYFQFEIISVLTCLSCRAAPYRTAPRHACRAYSMNV